MSVITFNGHHSAFDHFKMDTVSFPSGGVTEEHSVDSGQEEEDQGQGVIAEENNSHGQALRCLQRGHRVDDDEAGPQDQRARHTHGDEQRLVEVVRQVARFEGQYGADDHQKQIVREKGDESTQW